MATSTMERRYIGTTLAVAPGLRLCIFGFLIMALISLVFSQSPTVSLTQLSDMILNWYLPLFATVLVIRSEVQAESLYKTLAYFSLVVAAVGIVSFMRESNFALDIIPRPLLANMMAANKTIADLVASNPFRNGFYRSSSIFHVGLSFGEFGVMVAPIAAYFILHGRSIRDRILGFVVMIGALLTFFVSGSRGGSVGFVVTMPVLLAMFVYRYSRLNPLSMVGPLAATFSSIGVVAFLALIFLSTRLHNIIFGGYDAASSNDARMEQTQLAMAQVAKNPIFGHGIGLGGEVINWITAGGVGSVDSYFLSVIVETGIPGAIFYFGMIFIAAAILIRIYLTDLSRSGEIAGPLACSFLSYGFYRFFLSQKENQTLFFIFLGLTFIFAKAYASRLAARQPKRVKTFAPGARARTLAGAAPAEPERLPVS
jgi:O-antigen ligase